jgi:hypothetical protein
MPAHETPRRLRFGEGNVALVKVTGLPNGALVRVTFGLVPGAERRGEDAHAAAADQAAGCATLVDGLEVRAVRLADLPVRRPDVFDGVSECRRVCHIELFHPGPVEESLAAAEDFERIWEITRSEELDRWNARVRLRKTWFGSPDYF